jgi:hypothetical protein
MTARELIRLLNDMNDLDKEVVILIETEFISINTIYDDSDQPAIVIELGY